MVAGEFSWLREPTSDKSAEAWRQDWEITACSWISKGTDSECGHSFSLSRSLTHTHTHTRTCTSVCTCPCWRSILTPKGPFVSLKRLLNESVFPLAAQSHLEREHNAMSVSICYCQSLPHCPPCVYCLFGARFIHFPWATSLIFLLARCCASVTARGPASWAAG